MSNDSSSASLNNCRIFDTGKSLQNFDCHSVALNDQETHLILVGNRELAFINFETINAEFHEAIITDTKASLPSLFDVKLLPLFDSYNANRPIVQWNHCETKQYAVAIDRLVRFYTIDHGNINEATSVIDSQHQRPISALSFAPYDAHWLLTGSLDGQIQVWDTRQSSAKCPASLKVTVSTPFSIRRVQWSSANTNNINQLAVQCDRHVRVYDIRRPGYILTSSTDLQYTQRIMCMDWIKQTPSIVTLSMDQSVKISSLNGRVIAESSPNEHSSSTSTKIRTTMYDNLLVSASRDTTSTTCGFLGWHWDGDNCLQPLNSRILTATPSPIVDFTYVTNPRFFHLFNNSRSSRVTDDLTNRFLLLTWCLNGQLCLVDMYSIFRQTLMNQHTRTKLTSSSDLPGYENISRKSKTSTRHHELSQTNWLSMGMNSTQSEIIDSDEACDDEESSPFQAVSVSPPNTTESSDCGDEGEYPAIVDRSGNLFSEVSIANEFRSIKDSYGDHIFVEKRDEQRRMCVLRCIYSAEKIPVFHIYLTFSRNYPIISQICIRFKSSIKTNDEQFKSFQSRIKTMLEQTCYNCFYQGQLCLSKCLLKLKILFDKHFKQERFLSNNTSQRIHRKRRRDKPSSSFDTDPINNFTNSDNNSNRLCHPSTSSMHTIGSQVSLDSLSPARHRTCGARFSGSIHLVCFGQTTNQVQPNGTPAVSTLNDGQLNRPQSLPIRSTSLTVSKTRENSNTDEQSSYRTAIIPSTVTNTVQIQYASNNQRTPIYSAPVRSSFSNTILSDHQHSPIGHRQSVGHTSHPLCTVSIHDISILLPVCKILEENYRIDLKNPIEMCEKNEESALNIGKNNLSHCWRLLNGLLGLQSSLKNDDPWFQTPIAQGLVKHIALNYIKTGDIQSASMFILTMSQTSYLKKRISTGLVSEHDFDPILYAYASLLHRWKYFYKRTQILSQIDHNCQSPAPSPQISSAQTATICSICLKPVLGQHFLCVVCGHGGHLLHLHQWFSSDPYKHRYCPEKDCSCRCIIRQQELLAINKIQLQQPLPVMPRPFMSRQPPNSFRPL